MNRLEFFFEKTEPFKIDRNNLQKQIDFLFINEKKTHGEISVIFCNDPYLLKLNEQYLGHDYYTDIVTFDYGKNSVISGDLFISVDRVAENATQFGTAFMEEIYRVVLHGILHLTGYKDKTEAEKKAMRKKENFYLKGIDLNREKI